MAVAGARTDAASISLRAASISVHVVEPISKRDRRYGRAEIARTVGETVTGSAEEPTGYTLLGLFVAHHRQAARRIAHEP
jgi:hypothetical protein